MKNYLKMTLAVMSLLFLFALTSNVSAAHAYNSYTYTDQNSFSYVQNDDGFRVVYGDSRDNYEPYHSSRGYTYCDIYDWSYGGKKCARSYSNRPYYPDHTYYEDGYDNDQIIQEAFRTYRNKLDDDQEIRLETLRLQDRQDQRRYDRYGGYGYGYSGRRYVYGFY